MGGAQSSPSGQIRTTLDAAPTTPCVPTKVEIGRAMNPKGGSKSAKPFNKDQDKSTANPFINPDDKSPSFFFQTPAAPPQPRLESAWWTAQMENDMPPGVALASYGKQYGSLHGRTCGVWKTEFKKCMTKHKFDVFNMAQWYGVCGLFAESESQCASGLIRKIDVDCKTVLDRAAAYARSASAEALAEQVRAKKLNGSLEAVGRCVGTVKFEFEEDARKSAQDTFDEKKRAFSFGQR